MPEDPIKILLVDDNNEFRDTLSMNLVDLGYQCVEAANGNEAIDLYLKQPFDLIISDIFMPEMDGLELLEYFQNHPETRIIMISGGGGGGIDLLETAAALGNCEVLRKPFDTSELDTLIRKLLAK